MQDITNQPRQRKSISTISMSGIIGPAIAGTESVKSISETILECYDKENVGWLSQQTVEQIMKDMYRSMNIDITPSAKDVETFMKIMDVERSEKINENNLERLAKRYLINNKYEHRRSMGKAEVGMSMLHPSVVEKKTLESVQSTPKHTEHNTQTAPQSVYSSAAKAKTDDIKVAFTEFDFDKDGKINSFEFQRSLMRFGWKFGVNPIKINMDEVFSSGDSDGDGLITFDEYASIIMSIN